ncbi:MULTISPECIES: gluconokinase [Cyanophyceae]|uniref:Gluconokinase n=1 Tax=Nodularia spumigena CENA596 TaxID=1819295 RepID=A0A161URA8_NODSP|nr:MULTISPECIES: gluconokinase [Cyanophyceae]MDB9355321.1 gluconokinase [Nodularia spumigena CS-587/03]KZL48313.1 gluconate kinase [Nodularia spumigena CENA596]MDB9303828.1 gluconokinase [Nodularia spumigena CS-591/12]MDB9318174.1 gluconokinase [Nodularia spumigena CS-590/01A]MDB9321402.1 gluconokinase [Nodularia spumigena CS-591/07A]
MIIIIMGVSGAGKTTIGKLLADALNWEFKDADEFHSIDNIEKMRLGIPLNDTDRKPWLKDLQTAIALWLKENVNIVLACSALKANYRQYLVLDSDRTKLIYLHGSLDLLQQRLIGRQNHFMSEKLLNSQLDALEEPDDAIFVDVSEPPQLIVNNLKKVLGI